MDYRSRYEEFLERSMRTTSCMDPQAPHLAVGYTSDLDVVLTWEQSIFDALIARHLHGIPAFEESQTIDSLEDLAGVLAYYVIHGLGGEMEISSPEICDWLVNNFESTKALGGTGAQCGAALGTIGYPAVIHISDKCRQVCKFLDYPSITAVKNGRLVSVPSIASDDMPVYHFICQYSKGTTVTVEGKTYVAPESNRLILEFDTIHKNFRGDAEYYTYLEEHAKEIRALSISGFNSIVDPKIAQDELKPLIAHFQRLKTANPDLTIYLESAHYLSGKVRETVFEMLGPAIDILGMNEEEVTAHTALEGMCTDKSDFDSIVRGLEFILNLYRTRGIILHTKDYSAYYGEELPVDIELGLTAGNLLSGTRARVGHYGNLEECQESLRCGFSETGLEFYSKVEAWRQTHPEKQLIVVPSRYLEQPKCTIGLGDTFVAGVLTCFA